MMGRRAVRAPASRRSREGARIEISNKNHDLKEYHVAPVRERGLKLQFCVTLTSYYRRSREGARIEIADYRYKLTRNSGRSREGARIEIPTRAVSAGHLYVAPVRERGLKFSVGDEDGVRATGRSREGARIEIVATCGII